MLFFSYQLRNNEDGSQSGPAGLLPLDAMTGVTANGIYYGAANIPSLNVLVDFQATSVSWATANSAGMPAMPGDYVGFIHWMAATFDFATMLSLNASYVSFPWFCQYGNAAGIQYCITDALATAKITSGQYALFQGAVQTFNLPVVLP